MSSPDATLRIRIKLDRVGEIELEMSVSPGSEPALSVERAQAPELSGPQWCARFPGSSAVSDLNQPFRGNVERFIAAMGAAHIAVDVNATYRPPERAYLMHYCWRIAEEGLEPDQVPALPGVNINWVHPTAAASLNAARQMVSGYGIVFRPAYPTRHSLKVPIDMDIQWDNDVDIVNAAGSTVRIAGTPRTGMHPTLHTVGSGYGVVKNLADRPHWSDNGS